MPTLERPQEATVLNKSLIEAFDLPISLESEIISILPLPCHLPVFFFFFIWIWGLVGFQLIKVLIVFDSAAGLMFIYLNNEMQSVTIFELLLSYWTVRVVEAVSKPASPAW